MMKTKSALECEYHYFQTYLDSAVAPMPADALLGDIDLPPAPDYDTSPRESRPSIAHERNLQDRHKKDRTTPAEFAGWMPRRSEFEVEYLNDAEQGVGGILFSEADDTAATLEQKLSALRAYNEKLEERHIRTHFAVEWDLLEHEFRSFGGRLKSERDLEDALLPLAQVVPREVLTRFVHAVQGEMKLREEIETCKKWRRNGIVNRDEGVYFNQLESLITEDKLSPSAIEKWNRDVAAHAESAEFRASLDRELLSPVENQICQNFGVPPHGYLQVKDLLLREFIVRMMMNRELAASFIPGQEQLLTTVYELLKAEGLFYNIDDIGQGMATEMSDASPEREESVTEEEERRDEDTAAGEESAAEERSSAGEGNQDQEQ
jgi:transcriptional adapter 2-alpha